jgi:thiamine biosynthesis lipoprotein
MSIERAQFAFPQGVTPSVSREVGFSPVPLHRYALSGATMGTRYGAIFFAPEGLDTEVVNRALGRAVDLVDNQMSSWKPASDLCRFNASVPGDWVEIPPEFATVIGTALEIGRASEGAFDIGVGDLVEAWGFGPGVRKPNMDRISALKDQRRPVTTEILDLDGTGHRLRKRTPVTLDLSGIAKGFGVDQLARCLDGLGITAYLVSIDGETRARGNKPGGHPWTVAVELPDRWKRDVARLISTTDVSIATSGDYRHWVEHGGNMVSHTMHPQTHRPLGNAVASVTVLAADCMTADAWATALMVLGEIEGPATAARLGLEALFIVRKEHVLIQIPVGQRWAQGE